ncbi:DUF4276 family protein [Klenkia sp. LSe6-5]|uniref:DUF4276 family protein n=1 Tax=Klenkia sesuvii TaxID=3103137 RepID=A0ABU8DS47_9ACTN
MSETPVIATIVEGHGEVKALPVLLRRMAAERGHAHIDVPNPWRLDRGRYASKLADTARAATKRVRTSGGLLVVLDADDDCPVSLAEELRSTMAAYVSHCPIEVAVACREFEAWFLASLASLHRHRDVVPGDEVADPDAPRGAKELLERRMTSKYSPTLHQPAFAAMMDIRVAVERSRSFRHLDTALSRLLSSST